MAVCIRVGRYLCILVLVLVVGDWVADACFVRFHEEPPAIESRPGQFCLTSAGAGSHSFDDARNLLAIRDNTPSSTDRIAANQRAQDYLRNLVLFRDGRGMHSTPAFASFFDWIGAEGGWKQSLLRTWFAGRTGVNFDRTNLAIGFKRTSYENVPVVAQGCAVCHVGKVLGKIVPGLGNKNIDPYALASSGQWELSFETVSEGNKSPAAFLAAEASRFRDHVADERLGNMTQGMVSVATIMMWFYAQAEEAAPAEMARAAVKVPALWGYGEKRKKGQFCDGFADGMAGGWPAMVELVGGQRPETVREYKDVLLHTPEALGDLLPPAYPMTIDVPRALEGRTVFRNNCQRCHGKYEKDENRLPIFQVPNHIPIDVVRTDADRLRSITPEFFAVAERSPLADLIRCVPNYRPGYFAPRLDGIWARFPYLHNGSVPSIADLLSPPDERPIAFDLRDAGEVYRFDPARLGLTTPARGSNKAQELFKLGEADRRDVYFVERVGHGNGGHEFGTKLGGDEKRALIEYLKTL